MVNGVVQSTVLDLAVNSGSERGLLGIALHPNFATNPQVYLYWTESTTGADTTVLSETPLMGNRVDRFVWNGSMLTFDRNIIQLRALQPPFAAEPTPAAGRGNHDGGVIKFGPDGKLYIFIGDVGRRGWMQNLLNGPYQPGDPVFGTDDNFGGPEPDDAHLTGVHSSLERRRHIAGRQPVHGDRARVRGAAGGRPGGAGERLDGQGLRGVLPGQGDDVVVVHRHCRRPRFYGRANRRPGRRLAGGPHPRPGPARNERGRPLRLLRPAVQRYQPQRRRGNPVRQWRRRHDLQQVGP